MYIDQVDMCIAVSKALRDQSFRQEGHCFPPDGNNVNACDAQLLVLLLLAAHVCC